MHFANLTCVILTSTLLKFVTGFSKLSAGWWQETILFITTIKYVTFTALFNKTASP